MAAGTRDVLIRFRGDTTGLSKASSTASAGMGKWRASTVALGVAAGAALVKLGQLAISFARDSVKSFVEAQQAQTKLTDAWARFPKTGNINIDLLRRFNSALAKKVKFDDDALASGQAILAQFKLTGIQILNLTPLLADYAAKTGKDIPTAAKLLGKAFLGNTKALKELGINYKSTGNQAKDTANITKLLQAAVGGFAKKEGKTAAGQAAILANQFGEIKETVGEKLLPVLMKLAEWGLKIVAWIQQNSQVMGPLLAVIAAVVAIQWAWNVAMAANPIGLIVIGIAALIAIIVLVATRTRFFQNIWKAAWGGIKAVAAAVGTWFRDTLWRGIILAAFNAINNKIIAVRDTFRRVFSAIKGFVSGAFGTAASIVRGAMNTVIDVINGAVGGLNRVIGLANRIPGVSLGFIPTLPRLHSGGIVPGRGEVPIMAMGGERVLTEKQQAAMDAPMIVETHIHIGDEVVRVVRTEIDSSARGLRRRMLAGAH